MNADGEQYEVIFLVRNDGDGTRKAWGTYLTGQMENLVSPLTSKKVPVATLVPSGLLAIPKLANGTCTLVVGVLRF